MLRRYRSAVPAVLALLWVSCVDDGTSLRVNCNVVPEVEDGLCTYEADTEACVTTGRLNLMFAESYRLHLSVQSGLLSRQSDIPIMTEPNGMDVENAIVEVVDTSGEPVGFGDGLPNPFKVPTSGRVEVGAFGLATVLALPRDYVQALRNQDLETIVLNIKLKAETDGHVSVDSRTWRWPIEILREDDCRPTDDPNAVSCTFGQDLDAFPFCPEI